MNDAATGAFLLFFIGIYLFVMVVFMIMWVMIWAFTIALILLLLAGFVLWVFMLIDCINREEDDFPPMFDNPKNTWILILAISFAVGFYWLAAIIYYVMVKQKDKQIGSSGREQ